MLHIKFSRSFSYIMTLIAATDNLAAWTSPANL